MVGTMQSIFAISKLINSKKNMLKRIAIVSIVSCLAVGASVATKAQTETQKFPFPEWAKGNFPPEVYQDPKDKKDFEFPDNSKKPEGQLIKKELAIKGKLKDGFVLRNQRLVKYSQFTSERKQESGTVIENLQVHPNRQVYLSTIDANKGVDIAPKGERNPIKYGKSVVIIVTDAETGIVLDTIIRENKI
jgi:hypothetical protein